MTNLTKAHDELYRRGPDETFPTMQALWDRCYRQKEQSADRWHPPGALSTRVDNHALVLAMGGDGAFSMNDWSFSQLCRLAEVTKDTVNRLSPATASTVLAETLPKGNKPFQILTHEDRIRSSSMGHACVRTLFNWERAALSTDIRSAAGPETAHYFLPGIHGTQ